jgi:hypothetical protein
MASDVGMVRMNEEQFQAFQALRHALDEAGAEPRPVSDNESEAESDAPSEPESEVDAAEAVLRSIADTFLVALDESTPVEEVEEFLDYVIGNIVANPDKQLQAQLSATVVPSAAHFNAASMLAYAGKLDQLKLLLVGTGMGLTDLVCRLTNYTPFHQAAMKNHLPTVQWLLEEYDPNFDINMPIPRFGSVALIIRDAEMCTYLLSKGLDLNVRCDE